MRWKLAGQIFPRQLVQRCLNSGNPSGVRSVSAATARSFPTALLLPRPAGPHRTPSGRTRSPEDPKCPPTQPAAASAPGHRVGRPYPGPQLASGGRGSPAPSRICQFPLTAALHPASRTPTSAQRSRPPPPPPPRRAGTHRPHPPRPADTGPNRRCSPCSYRQHFAGRRRPAPTFAPPTRPRPAHLGLSPLALSRPGAGLGALQQKGRLLALVRGALVVSCTLVRRPQRCRTNLPPRAACRRTGGANLRNKSPFAFQQ